MDARTAARLALDPSVIMEAQGMRADRWQREFLLCEHPKILLCCSRGAGKSKSTSAKALHRALHYPQSLVLIVSPSQRQSGELFNYVRLAYKAIGRPLPLVKETEREYRFSNESRIVCVPGKEQTIRSFQGVSLLIKDEASRVPDDLNATVTPMVAISRGQQVDLSTPFGQRGYFWKRWTAGGEEYKRFRVPWQECPRYNAAFIASELREHGESWVKQEYECSFESVSGVVFPDFDTRCGIDFDGPGFGRRVGGIDFGFRDPFCGLWGAYEPIDDLLTIRGEHYQREEGLHANAAALPPGFTWEADPSQPLQIQELRRAGLHVRKAFNKIEPGIAAVRARIERGKLKVVRSKCPNLLAEAALYRYDPDKPGENPVDDNNHALDALRYLIARIDRGFIAKYLKNAGLHQSRIQEDTWENEPEERQKLEAAEALYGARLRKPDPEPSDYDKLMNPELWESMN